MAAALPPMGARGLLWLLLCLSLLNSLSFSAQAQTACSTTPGTLLQWNFNSTTTNCNGAVIPSGGKIQPSDNDPLFYQNTQFFCPNINSGCGAALLGSKGHNNTAFFTNAICLSNFFDPTASQFSRRPCPYNPNSTVWDPENCANFYVTYTVPAGKSSCVSDFQVRYLQKQDGGNTPNFEKQGFAVKRNGVLIYSTTHTITSGDIGNLISFPVSGSEFCTDGNANVTYTLIFGLVHRLKNAVTGYDDITVLGTCGLPNVSASAKAATCSGGSPASNASITLTNFGTGNRFAFTTGSSYTGSATFASATAIPANGIIASNLAGVSSPQTYTVRIFSASCYIDRTVTLNPTSCAPVCTQPAGSVVAVQATCSGATASNNAQVRVSGVTNGDRAGLVAGSSGASLTYGSASTLSGGAFTFTGLANPGSAQTYTVRIFNGSGSCFTDRTITLNPANCVAACTQPSGTVTDVSATCSGTAASNNAQVTVTGVTNGDRADIVAGGSGASLTYSGANTLSGGAFTFTGLANPATSQVYTVRIFNGSNTCFVDRTVTINTAVCPAPPTCTNPSGTATAVAATCSGSTANSNGQIIVSGVTNGNRVAIVAGGSGSGLTYASASALSGGGFTLSGLTNPTTSVRRYTVRIFNGSNTCYTDIAVDLPAAPCTTCQPMCAEIIASDAADPNSEPDNGLGTEDDYACADVCTGNQRIHLVLNKTVSPATVTVGGNVTFSLTLQNTGTLSASAIQVADTLINPVSTNLFLVSATPSSGTFTAAQGWQIDNLAAGATATLSIVAQTMTPGSYTNCTQIVGVFPPRNDTDTTQYISCVPFTVTGPPPPLADKDFSPDLIKPNVPFQLTLKLTNRASTPITLTAPFVDNLPATMVIAATPNLSTSPTMASVQATAGGTSITIPTGTVLLPGLNQIYVDVTVPASGTYCNTIAVGALQTSGGNNLFSTTVCVKSDPTFVLAPMLSKTFGPNGLATGQVGSLTITVENRNAISLTTIQDFNDYLPQGLVLAAGSNTGTCPNVASFAASGTVITMNTGAVLPPGKCTIIVPVTSSVAGLYCNTIPQNALITTGGGVAMLGNEDIAQACLKVTNTPCTAITGATLTRTPTGAVTPGSVYTLTTTATGTGALTTYAYSANGGILFANAGANPTSFTAPVTAGVYTVTVVVNNNATGSGSCTATATNSFTIAGPTAGLGDYVFLDANKDGIQNTGDTPIPGVTVTLFINGVVSATTVTNASGLYSFTGLTPGSSNSYSVGFTQPTGLTATLQQAGGNDALDSDADVITGRTRSVTLANGEFNPNLDAGFYAIPASLGDYVFRDNNLNGIQDAGDVPIPGVTATLYINGVASATTVTNASGLYSFTGLTPGNSLSYSVGFSTPTGLTATLANQGGNDALDSDADLITGRTQSITLAPGENNPTLDAGFYAPIFDLALIKTLASGQASSVTPGSQVTFTITVFNQGNVGASAIQVSDYIPAGLTLNDANWTASGGIATLVAPIASLSAGGSTTRNIVFTVSNTISASQTITNVAEISSATGGTDIDSTPDNNPANDAGGAPGTPSDDATGGNGTGTPGGNSAATDEDDADPAQITVTPLPVCSINPVVTVGPCLTATNTYSTTAVVTLANTGTGGTLTVSTQGQNLTTTVGAGLSSFTYTATFTGLLSNGTSQSVTASLPGCSSVTVPYTAPVSCSVAAACSIATPVVTAGVCNSATNTFSSSVTVTVANPVGGQTLTVNDGASTLTFSTSAGSSNSFTATFNNLPSNNTTRTITVSLPGCGSATTTYTAPASCVVAPVCSLSATASAGLCQTATNTFSSSVQVIVTNPIGGQTLSVTDGGQTQSFTTTAGSQNTFTAIFNGLLSDGSAHLVNISLPGCGATTATYMAPTSCSIAPVCSVGTPVVTVGVCNSATNSFSSTVVVTVTNPTGGGTLTVSDGASSQSFTTTAASSNSFTAVFAGLNSNGASRTVTVSLPGCGSATATYTAPVSCTPTLVCQVQTPTVTVGPCLTATNTYSTTAVVTVQNPVGGATLTISNGITSQPFTTTAGTSNTFTMVFNGLTSDGTSQTITASLPGCGSATATYTAPISCSVAPPVCSVGTPVVTVGVCNSATNAYSTTAVVTLSNTSAGVLTVSNGTTSLTTTVGAGLPSFTYTATFTGLVSDGSSQTITASLPGCGSATATYTAPVSCTPTLVCQVQTPTITAGVCDTATNTYSTTAVVTVQNPADGATLTISNGVTSQPFTTTAGTSNTFTMVFNGLVSNGASQTITASLPGCGSATATYTAPASCSVAPPVCSINPVVTVGPCLTATNTYSATAVVTLSNTTAGVLTVSNGTTSLTTTVGAGLPSFTYTATFTGLTSDGSSQTITASLPGCGSATATYTAPISCSATTLCQVQTPTITAGVCDTATNTYSTTAVVTVQNPADGATLTISNGVTTQPFTTTAGSSNTFTMVFNGLVSNGASQTITASLPGCGSATATYTAPVSCSVAPPVCTINPVVTVGPCLTATNTYSATAVVTLTNTSAGVLTVSNGTTSLTTTVGAGLPSFTYTATFTGLTSDGSSQTITASLPGCGSATAPYTAPISCSATTLCQVQTPTITAGVCDTATNTYSTTAVVTVQNPADGATLTISNGVTSQPFTTTAGSSNTFTMVFTGLTSDGTSQTITASLPGCGSATATYTAPASCSVAPPVCSINPVVSVGPCLTATNTYSATAVVTLSNTTAGVLTVSNGTTSLTTTVGAGLPSFTYTATFTGLTSDGSSQTITASLPGCGSATAPYTAPISCSATTVCQVQTPTITAGVCDTATNTYSTTAVVTVQNPADGATLTISNGVTSQPFTTTAGSSNTFTMVFNGLTSDGTSQTITASLPGCGSATATYTAPVSCSVAPPVCAINPVVSVGPCLTATNTYSATAVVTLSNTTAGVLTVSNGTTSLTTTVGGGLSTFTYTATFSGLTSDGTSQTITATLAGCGSATATYTAPVSCSATTVCQVQTPTITAGVCDTATNTYSTTAVVTVQNPVGGATLSISNGVTSQPFTTSAGTSNTFTMVFNGLTSDGTSQTITASLPGCGSATATYTAPVSCSVAPPVCAINPVVSVGPCLTATNTYSATAVVTLTNTTAGVLTVSNGTTSLTTTVGGGLSTFTYTATFTGLVSDGSSQTITASLPGCGSATAQYTAPVSCSATTVCQVQTPTITAGVCDTATNTYSTTAVVTVQNPADGATLSISNGVTSQPFTTSAGTSNTFTMVFNGLVSDGTSQTITASLAGCGSQSATYTAPVSCSVTPPTAGLGDFVFLDVNQNGIQDAGDAPIPGVLVTLYTNGVASLTTLTDASGLYSFTGLTPGNSLSYSVGFGTPTGLTPTTANVGANDAADSDADVVTGLTQSVTLANGEFNPTLDAGFFSPAVTAGLGDFVFLDVNQNGIQDAGDTPIPGVLVTLYTNGVASLTTLTDASGLYSFTGLTPGNSLSYSVGFGTPTGLTPTTANVGANDALDSDADVVTGLTQSVTLANGEFNPTLDAGFVAPAVVTASLGDFVFVDQNHDGIQQPGEPGIPGVVVTLISNGTVVASTTTNGSGIYSFTGLTPGVPYSVSFTAPAGYTATAAQQGGDDTKDSDANPLTGQTRSVTLAAGENNPNLDAGFYLPTVTAGLGDFVFTDVNKNGIQDAGDTPLAGVVVTLFTNGVASATTVSSATGFYSFTGLTPGSSLSYSVGFTTPTGLTATSLQTGGNDATDSDASPATGLTRSVTLAAGEFNPKLDAGFVSPTPSLTLQKVVDKSMAFQGDTLTYTLILTNTGQTSAINVVVRDSANGLTYVAGTVSAPAGTTYAQGLPVSLWTVSTISAGQSLSLTYQAIVDSTGVIYNTATIPGVELPEDSVKVCTSVPIKICIGDTITLTAPAGRTSYSWYRNGVLIVGQSTNVLTITQAGSYSLSVAGAGVSCPDFSCCPVIVEVDSLPVFAAIAIPATCVGNAAQANGQLTISSFNPTHTYQYSLGATFNAAASLSGAPKVIPAGGVLASNLVSPASATMYTVRVYNSSGCYTDQTVILMPTICGCPADVCVPYVIQQTKRVRRIGDPIK